MWWSHKRNDNEHKLNPDYPSIIEPFHTDKMTWVRTNNKALHMFSNKCNRYIEVLSIKYGGKSFRKRDWKQESTQYLLWKISCPLATFRPLLFSATHSYTPASSGRKYGISRSPLEWLILILPGSGFPSALLHEMEGTGLKRSSIKGHTAATFVCQPVVRRWCRATPVILTGAPC